MENSNLRINKIWSVMNGTGLNEFKSKQSFLDWVNNSDYTEWKVIKRKNNTLGYNDKNCYWKSDNRIRGDIELVSDNDSLSNIKNIVKYTYSELDKVKGNLDNLSLFFDELMESKHIKSRAVNSGSNKKHTKNSALELEKCIELIESILVEMDSINFEKTKNA